MRQALDALQLFIELGEAHNGPVDEVVGYDKAAQHVGQTLGGVSEGVETLDELPAPEALAALPQHHMREVALQPTAVALPGLLHGLQAALGHALEFIQGTGTIRSVGNLLQLGGVDTNEELPLWTVTGGLHGSFLFPSSNNPGR